MIIGCPHCKTRYRLNDDKIGDQGVKLRCTKCHTLFRVSRSNPPAPATGNSRHDGLISVIMAHESPAFCATVTKVLAAEHFRLATYNDGKLAYEAIRQERPDVVLLDVALPSMFGFEICEEIRKDDGLASIKIILIASIYDKTRYKRCPQSLYGADDYIEKHHIPDDLATKIFRLVAEQKQCASSSAASKSVIVDPASEELDEQDEVRRRLQQAEERETPDTEHDSCAESHLKARKLARSIASDIALYNQAKVEEGVKTGKFYELLADDIMEGRQLFDTRVSAEIRNDEPYLDDAFREIVSKVEKELGL